MRCNRVHHGTLVVAMAALLAPSSRIVAEQPIQSEFEKIFTARIDVFLGPTSPRAVFAADVNGNGLVDLLSASGNDGAIRIHWNLGGDPPSFATDTIFAQPSSANSVHAADVNGNGLVDVVWPAPAPNTVYWAENTGDPKNPFVVRTVFEGAASPRSAIVADLNGDGAADVISGSLIDNTIRWHRNVGGDPVTFVTSQIATNDGAGWAVCAADIDGDGHLDIVSAEATTVRWYRNSGGADPSFSQHVVGSGFQGINSVAAGDLTGDGRMDIVSAAIIDGAVRWHRNLGGDPVMFETHTIVADAPGAYWVFLADITGNGRLDIISCSEQDNTVRWHENVADEDGAPTFITHTVTTAAHRARAVFAADVTGDGAADILSASAFDRAIRLYRNDRLRQDRVWFRDHVAAQTGVGATFAVPADFVGDGRPDLASAWLSTHQIQWHRNLQEEPWDTPTFEHKLITNITWPGRLAAGDLTGNGRVDLVSTSLSGTSLQWHENRANLINQPSFVSRSVVWGGSANSVALGDIDGDGRLDIVTSGSSSGGAPVRWVRNTLGPDGLPEFVAHAIPTLTPSATATAVVVGDITGDGLPDVLSGYNTAPQGMRVQWHRHVPAEKPGEMPSFTAHLASPEPLGTRPVRAVHLADMTGDGRLDALSGTDQQGLWLHRNTGADDEGLPIFETTAISVVPGAPGAVNHITTWDITGNGLPDIIVSLSGGTAPPGDVARWFENLGLDEDGVPRFLTHIVSTAPLSGRSVFAADLDGDGDIDILTADIDGNTVWWHENRRIVAQPLLGDLNGDGVVNGVDLAVLLTSWGACPQPPAPCDADINGDGLVNGVDLAILLTNWTG